MDSKIVLDAGAFYAGVPFGTVDINSTGESCALSSDVTYVTSPLIYDEISHIKKDHNAIEILIETKRLLIQSPESKYINDAQNAARITGDLPNLSEPDISVIALCIQTKFALITDDFAMLNVMRKLKMRTISVMTRGIKRLYRWQYYCPGCGDVPSASDMPFVRNDVTPSNKNKHTSNTSKKRKNTLKKTLECKLCGSTLNRRTVKSE